MKPDQRSSRRKPLRAHGTVTFDGAAPLAIHTIDIGSGGLSIGMSLQLKPGQRCQVRFDLYHQGKKQAISVPAKVGHCICGGNDGFKAELLFIEMDPAGAKAIAEFVAD
ncbi:hypothetical protein AAKU58_004447 [Oxalobacteraceae bacterium GrIS 1.18]